MTDDSIELTRRTVLAGLGAAGVASAGAGLGTSAFFSDGETFTNNSLVAGELDMKVGYSAHYSDWSPDEGEGVDVVMWDGAPDTTGDADDLPGDYSGLPADAAWLVAVDDPEQFLANTQRADVGSASCDGGTDSDDLERVAIDVTDVKPGDFGEVTFDFALCDNPGYVWMQGDLVSAAENGYSEPEMKDDDESGDADGDGEDDRVELLDVVQAAVWVDDGNDYQNGDETVVLSGSLGYVLGALGLGRGLGLDGDIDAADGGGMGRNCFSAGNDHSVAFAWWVPVDHGNEIQTDSATFDLGFYTVQCWHNDGADVSTGLVGHYPFESVRDGTVEDRSGTGNDGTVQGGVSPASGRVGSAASFDGTADYVRVPDDGSLDITGPYTETAWVYPTATGGRNDITMKDPGQWALGFQVEDGALRAGFEDESDNNYIGHAGTVPAGDWTHLAVVYTGTHVHGYVDGSQVFDLTSASDGSGIAVSDATPATNDQPLTIGAGEGYFEGRIDELRIYDRALDQAEVQTLADQ
jgi:predicted ribosomally synthesized peptide with SipW-like signal peptide